MEINRCYHTAVWRLRQGKSAAVILPRIKMTLLLAEGHAVGALILGRIALVSTYHNTVQGAVILAFAVVSALMDGTLNALVGMIIHNRYPPFCWVLL